MGDEPQLSEKATSAPEQEQELEFRPFVKYIGLGLVGIFVLSAGYASFALGHKQGYDAGISSGMVEASINAAAVQSLTRFMQSASADDAELLAMASDVDKTLGWVNDSEVRREAEWLLGCTLMQRRKTEQALPLLDKLFLAAPKTAVWARRAAMTAECLLNEQQPAAAQKWYRIAADRAGESGLKTEQIHALTHLAALHLNAAARGEDRQKELNQLLREADSVGKKETESLRALVLVYSATRHRSLGQEAKATDYFNRVIQSIPSDTAGCTASELVCYGVACREMGDTPRAEQLLRAGLSGLQLALPDILCHLMALRQLAVIEQEKGNSPAALSYLTRAEGVASGRIAADNDFWACLFEQRGWIYLLMDDYRNAHTDFDAALRQKPTLMVQIQAMEGAARCMLENEQPDEALNTLSECFQLRSKHMGGDTASLGRVSLLLAHAIDMAGRYQDAAEAYAKAAEMLSGDSQEQKYNKCMALRGRAHALSQLGQWEPALKTWEEVLSLTEPDSDERAEAEDKIQDCRSRLKSPDPDFTAE